MAKPKRIGHRMQLARIWDVAGLDGGPLGCFHAAQSGGFFERTAARFTGLLDAGAKCPAPRLAAGYLDYKLGHPSDKVIDLGLKAKVLRADLTDMLPGGRKVTDFHANTVPGPQYGPLALPAAGAFAGGLLHYSRVLRGADSVATEDLRKAGSRLLPM